MGGSATETEVIDLVDSNITCTSSYGKLEAERQWPVGGLIRNTPILCGGQDLNEKVYDSCILFGQNQTIKMNEKRFRSASVILNETTLWIMGGSTGPMTLSSTEFITLDSDTSINGPSLPIEMDSSCAIKYNTSHIYLTGGYYSGDPWDVRQDKVWIFNIHDINSGTSSWTEGPKMKDPRAVHGCTVLHQDQKSLIVVAGGWNKAGAVLSMEILDPLKNEWIQGEKDY